MPRSTLILALACALALGFGLTGGSAEALPDPLTCEGYPEKRVFLESQGWWTQPGRDVDTESEHIHLATCFPHAQTVKGVVEFDVRVMLHEIAGTLTFVRASIGSEVVHRIPLSVRCTGDCTYWYKLRVDTTAWPNDGRQEIRLTANVERDDGNRQFQSTGWQVYFANGKPVSHYRSSDLAIARGWYDLGFDYANATYEAPLVDGPVSGTWRPSFSFTRNRHFVAIDSAFHSNDRGIVISEGSATDVQPSIDTTKLADGWHRLVIRSDDVRSTGTNSGVLVVPFEVRNGSTAPPPTPDTSAPTAPANLRATAVRATAVDLAWSASSDNVGVAGYRVYRDGTQVATTSGTTYTVSGLACGTSYTLGAAAYDAAGNVSPRSTVAVTTASCVDTTAPAAPTGLRVASSGPSSLDLSWNASTDDTGVAGYDVYRDGTLVGRATGTTFTVGGVSCASGHTLGVVAVDAAGNRSAQSTLAVRCVWAPA